MRDLSDDDFETVLAAKPDAVIHFWAPENYHDQTVSTTLGALEERLSPAIEFFRFNVVENPAIPERLHLLNLPSIAYVRRGAIVRVEIGVRDTIWIAHRITEMLSSEPGTI